ncbi:MAG: hypothetical protein ACT4QF_08535 [Sporichthyaceae bacterium]
MRRTTIGGSAVALLAGGLAVVPAATARGAAPATGGAEGAIAVCWSASRPARDATVGGPVARTGAFDGQKCRTWQVPPGFYEVSISVDRYPGELSQTCRYPFSGVDRIVIVRPGMTRVQPTPDLPRTKTHVAAGEQTQVRFDQAAWCVQR